MLRQSADSWRQHSLCRWGCVRYCCILLVNNRPPVSIRTNQRNQRREHRNSDGHRRRKHIKCKDCLKIGRSGGRRQKAHTRIGRDVYMHVIMCM